MTLDEYPNEREERLRIERAVEDGFRQGVFSTDQKWIDWVSFALQHPNYLPNHDAPTDVLMRHRLWVKIKEALKKRTNATESKRPEPHGKGD